MSLHVKDDGLENGSINTARLTKISWMVQWGGENEPLITDELVALEKQRVECEENYQLF
jgi:hypothetical protein